MEIKAILNKPYTEKQRMDFIVQYNHRMGYMIQETATDMEAWGYTEEEIAEQKKIQRNAEIDNKIKNLQEMTLSDMINGNEENVKLYKEVIESLKESKEIIE